MLKYAVRTTNGGKANSEMALTREFKETLKRRVQADDAFRAALLSDAVGLLISGDVQTGKTVLRDFINATVGFEKLSEMIVVPSKSLMRMFGPNGNPSSVNLFRVIAELQKSTGVHLSVGVAA